MTKITLKQATVRFLKDSFGLIFTSLSLIAVLSYHREDACFNVSNELPVRNLLGYWGAIYADLLRQFFGSALYIVVMVPGIWSGFLLAHKVNKGVKLFNKYVRYAGFALLTCSACIILEKIRGLGGAIGKICIQYISGWAWAAVIATFLVGAVCIFNFRIWLLLTRAIFSLFKGLIFRKKEVLPSPRQIVVRSNTRFSLPPSSLLEYHRNKVRPISEEKIKQDASQLLEVLENFGVKGKVVNSNTGPVVTLHEFEPVPGTKSSRIVGLADDIARSMGAASARISNVVGKKVLGVEIPNQERSFFGLREIIESEAYQKSAFSLPIVLGKNLEGSPYVVDLARMPHLLIAGTTGSGKSVAINTFILSVLYRNAPESCKLILIDPKMLELSPYEGIPHLIAPVVTEPKKAVAALKWAVKEMENRYRTMSSVGVRNIESYNQKCDLALSGTAPMHKKLHTGFDQKTGLPTYEQVETKFSRLPYIVVVVDEMADLMMVAGKEVETSIQRLAQMARASGIHIIMATQRPSVDVITGVIKANFPSRISFKVTSKVDSRTIIGDVGAEQLLGAGDMLYLGGDGQILRAHGPFVAEKEIEASVSFLKTQGNPVYLSEITEVQDEENSIEGNESQEGDLYKRAIEIVQRDNKVSISYIQRRLHIGYNKAASLIEKMEEEGIVSAATPSGKREILS